MQPFIKKYAPKKSHDIIGQRLAIKDLKNFIVNFKNQEKKAVILYGPSGTGKTASVYALADELSLELIEINASDYRNKTEINSRVGSALNQQSLFSKGKIILVDEIDGLSGMKDRGGIGALAKLSSSAPFPIVFTSNNAWELKFNKLRKRCSLIKFKELSYDEISHILERICKDEGIRYEEAVLKGLARRSSGDARSAINDLQMLTEGAEELTKKSLDELMERNREESMPSALLKIFKTTDPNIAINAFDNVKEDFDQRFLWIDKNLPSEYENAGDLSRAYDKLSKADIFKRRIRRWQHWRFLVYINALITAGIAVSKDKKYKKFVEYKPTGRLLKLWWAKQKNMKKKAIASKIASKTHSSTKEVLKDIDYFKIMFRKNKGMAKAIEEYAGLEKEEVDWLKK